MRYTRILNWGYSGESHPLRLSFTIHVIWIRSITQTALFYNQHPYASVLSATLLSIRGYCSLTSRLQRRCFISNADCSHCAAPPELQLCFEEKAWWCMCMMFRQVLNSDVSSVCFLNSKLNETSEDDKLKAIPHSLFSFLCWKTVLE